jgi:hypothetical protein
VALRRGVEDVQQVVKNLNIGRIDFRSDKDSVGGCNKLNTAVDP